MYKKLILRFPFAKESKIHRFHGVKIAANGGKGRKNNENDKFFHTDCTDCTDFFQKQKPQKLFLQDCRFFQSSVAVIQNLLVSKLPDSLSLTSSSPTGNSIPRKQKPRTFSPKKQVAQHHQLFYVSQQWSGTKNGF